MDTIIVPDDVAELAMDTAGHDGSPWYHQCHTAAITIVQSGLFPGARVARGLSDHTGLTQHSWVVLPTEPGVLADTYDPEAMLIDPTAWSYDDEVTGVLRVKNLTTHTPHGYGFAQEFPRYLGGDREVEMPEEIANALSYKARNFLYEIGAITYGTRRVALPARIWMAIANANVQGWPAAEVMQAMHSSPNLAAFLKIDIVGMLTTINPGKLYLPTGQED